MDIMLMNKHPKLVFSIFILVLLPQMLD